MTPASFAPLLERFFTQRLMQQRQVSPAQVSAETGGVGGVGAARQATEKTAATSAHETIERGSVLFDRIGPGIGIPAAYCGSRRRDNSDVSQTYIGRRSRSRSHPRATR
jgi:hypothetical protein